MSLFEKKKKKNIAVLRGGKDDYHRSMKSGANIIISLSKYDDIVDVVDVVIDDKGNWFEKGIPSDTHKVFSKVDFYIDLTSSKNEEFHKLSSKLDVRPVFSNNYSSTLNRINIKRLLNQLNIYTPRHVLIRDKQNLLNNLKEIWSKFHTPIIIKDANSYFNRKSLITHSFSEALKRSREILDSGSEVIVEEHLHGKYISVAAIPNYRGEDVYIPTPAEIINTDSKHRSINGKIIPDKYLIDHNHEKRSATYLEDNLRREIRRLTEEIYKSLFLDFHTLIDIVLVEDRSNKSKNNFLIKVLEIHTNPHLFEDSRFDFVVKNSGVDIGKLIIDRIEKLEEDSLVY